MKIGRRAVLWAAGAVLVATHLAVLFAEFLSPYDPTFQNRARPYEAPTRVNIADRQGRIHWRPFVTDPVAGEAAIRFFVHGAPYRLMGLFKTDRHLFGVEAPAAIFPLGTDEYGRDQLSRLLYGGRISLLAALIATVISLGLAVLLGVTAGFFGGWHDDLIMRLAELFLAVPWLYLLLAVRAAFPLAWSPASSFLILIGLLGAVGWAGPARLIRGIVLTVKEREYVYAARGFGVSNFQIVLRHILPETYQVLLVQASVLAPRYILAEVTLSFLGLGAAEPLPSWGSMLSSLRHIPVITSCWWIVSPCLVLLPVLMSYSALSTASDKNTPAATL